MAAGVDTLGAAPRGMWYDAVRRRCVCARRDDTPPVGELAGEGAPDVPALPPSGAWDASVEMACSDTAVVGIAFAAADPRGRRAAENLDEVEPREAREPGRRGEGCEGA